MLNNDSNKDGRAIGAGLLVALLALGCSAEAAPPAPAPGGSNANSSGGNASASGGATSSASAGSGNTSSTPSGSGGATGGDAGKALPVVIDDYFAPSGYMEDARDMNAGMTPAFEGDDTTCGGNRSAGGRGFCHEVTFSTFPSGGLGWGGVFWQYPANNWGTMPGLKIAPGATKVRFQARGASGGEKVGFFAGIGAGSEAYADGFKMTNQDFTLTAEWQEYVLTLPSNADYSKGVVGPLAWGVGSEGNATPVKFYIDDITFE